MQSCHLPGSSIHPLGLSRQGYWSGLPFPTSGDFSDPGVQTLGSCSGSCITGRFFTAGPLGELVRKYRRVCLCPWGKERFPEQDLKVTTARINN